MIWFNSKYCEVNMYTWGYIKDVSLAKLDLTEKEANVQNLLSRFPFYANEAMTQICSTVKPKHTFFEIDITEDDINVLLQIGDSDFIAFDDDITTITYTDAFGRTVTEEAHDDYFVYKGYNQAVFFKVGRYVIPISVRWITFRKDMDDNEMLNVPNDILDCIPSYIASQCYKIDDEVKSSIFRNEYEMAMARIDNTNYKSTKTIKIGGDW